MRLYSCAGFSHPLTDTVASGVSSTAEGIRTAIACNDHHDWIDTIVTDAATRFETSIFVVGGWDWRAADGTLSQRRDANLLDDPGKEHLASQCASILAIWRRRGRSYGSCWIEVGNELDGSYWKAHLDQFYKLAMHCYDRVRAISLDAPFITGSTMNFNRAPYPWQRRGYEVLKKLCRLDWPRDTLQGLHPYRSKCRQDQWPTWDSSIAALAKLTAVLHGRGVAITEMGWPSGGAFTDDEIATLVHDELAMWDAYGAHCFAPYQIQDEPIPWHTGEGGFGIFTNIEDGFDEKPVACVLRDWLARNVIT